MATTAKDVESAKKTAEAVWVVEHATRCPDGGCGVAGCAKARKALTCLATRTVDASVSVSDIDAVRSVLSHRALCPWARPRGCARSVFLPKDVVRTTVCWIVRVKYFESVLWR